MQRLEFSFDHPTEIGVGTLLANGTRGCDLLLEESGHLTSPLLDALREEVGVLHPHYICGILLIGGFAFGAFVKAGKEGSRHLLEVVRYDLDFV